MLTPSSDQQLAHSAFFPSSFGKSVNSSPPDSSDSKSVYCFGDGKAEGTKDMKAVLGGKGANLAEMTNLGVPVPPGFTIACALCVNYLRDRRVPDSLRAEVGAALTRLEQVTGKKFGDQ